ncbi:MAG: ribosome maturation factor RimP [Synergistaceae bacterium]|nr:ribosome maturation factor RimP [Synergistaceae bacterium]
MNEALNKIFADLKEQINDLGYDCIGLELTTDNGMNVLTAYLDIPGGVDINDCEIVSRSISEYLDDVESDMPEKYYLAVSSPGLERPLFTPDDYAAYIGKEIEVFLAGGKAKKGTVVSVGGPDSFVLRVANDDCSIAFSDVKRGKLVYKEERGEKKAFKKIPKKKK